MGLAKRHQEEIWARGFGDTDKTLCLECVIDETLREETRPHLSESACSFCGAVAEDEEPIAAPFEDFMHIVMRAVRFLYMSVEDAGLVHDEGEWFGGHVFDSADVAYDICEGDVQDDVLEAVTVVLTDQLWTGCHIAETTRDQALRWGWDVFCDMVKHRSRFVFLSTPEEGSRHPGEFTAAEFLRELERILPDTGALLKVPAGRVFWRGRLADAPSKVDEYGTAAELGSPPREHASNNRMSPAGISMFYGSDDIDTVVAEIGAHSTRRYAIVGAFQTTRELTLLNLADLPPVPSLYREVPPGERYFDVRFLRSFATDLGKPITLDGREHIEYVPTQVVTEFLRFLPRYPVDGILFRSAQNDGVNCVLFCDSTGCVDADVSDHTYLRLQPDTVRWVRIVTKVATA
ncbi:HEPN-associated N-terminal domain-containing protein [Nonomuraea lactucae]|uniref:HEPN-associated N-terminal domain-containing protein n=1 Tax=Nonomuraea lactucae TaxID=2249762 RepID=UPI000DE4C6F9|nr:HEPN-associated N-terminal domain-containing protein [Nonomuraea lactucae]